MCTSGLSQATRRLVNLKAMLYFDMARHGVPWRRIAYLPSEEQGLMHELQDPNNVISPFQQDDKLQTSKIPVFSFPWYVDQGIKHSANSDRLPKRKKHLSPLVRI